MSFFFELFGSFFWCLLFLFIIYLVAVVFHLYEEREKDFIKNLVLVLYSREFWFKIAMFFIKYSLSLYILYLLSISSSGFETWFFALMIFFIDFWKDIAELIGKKSPLILLLVLLWIIGTIVAFWALSITLFEIRDISQKIDINWNSTYTKTRKFQEGTGSYKRIKEINCEWKKDDNGWYVFHTNCPIVKDHEASQTWGQIYYKKTMNFSNPEIEKLEDNIESVKKGLERIEKSLMILENKQKDNLLQSSH